MSLMSVPVIDLSPYLQGTPEGKRKVADEVGRACRDIGFLTITGHGVSNDLVEGFYAASRAFFDLPLGEKLKVKQPRPDQVRGYSAVGEEGLSYSLDAPTPPDLKESLTFGPGDDPPDDPYYFTPAAGQFFAPTLWPSKPPELKGLAIAYFRAMEKLSSQLMCIFALALNLPEHFFEDKIDKHISNLRVLHYPNQLEPPEKGQLRAGAHSDYGSLTIVRQEDAPGGLQVLNLDGEWVDVKPMPRSFVVNIGDLMMQWTNDRWRSTMHRVVNPPRDKANSSRRISLVFFHQPNYDAMVSCLDGCYDTAHPPKYAPITSGEHFIGKFVKQTTFGTGIG